MLSSGLIEFLFYLLIPVVLVNFLQGQHTNDSSLARKKKFSRSDYIVYGSLVALAAAYFSVALFNPPPNVFKRIGASPRMHCHDLRERLAEYGRSNPEIIPSSGIPTLAMKNDRQFELLDYYMGSSYGSLDFLIDRFCTYDEDRDVYLKFGEDAFMHSISSSFGPRGMSPRVAMPNGGKSQGDFIAEFPDIGFLLHSVASQFFTYLPAFVLVGLVTTPFFVTEFAPSRVYVRPWGVITLAILFFADMYWLFTVPTQAKLRRSGLSTLWIVSPDSNDPVMFYADAAAYTRKLFLAVSLIAFLFMDYLTSSRQTDIQLLKKCIAEQTNALTYSKDHTVLETAVLLSDRLRDRMVAMWRRERTARDRVFADAEFTAKYEKTALETKSKQWVEQNGPVALKRFRVGEQGAAHLSDGS
ncbi:hypothetical protein LPJ70_000811 [Coemansia sp. RSA 2708]|nr:hypothetical protein LPJ70_000811 [Coemansia sp. RSA 2708]